MERYCPLAKFEYISSAAVKLVKVTYDVFDQIFFYTAALNACRSWRSF